MPGARAAAGAGPVDPRQGPRRDERVGGAQPAGTSAIDGARPPAVVTRPIFGIFSSFFGLLNVAVLA